MPESSTNLLAALDDLPLEEKVRIAEHLLAAVPEDEEEEAFIAELNRRVADYFNGKDPGIPAEEVHRQMREKYG